MSVNDKTENRGTHGVSSSMLDTLVSSSENPLSLDMGSVNQKCTMFLLNCYKLTKSEENLLTTTKICSTINSFQRNRSGEAGLERSVKA